MATRRTSRKTARRRRTAAHLHAARSLYRRPLRYEPLEDRRLLALVTVTTLADTVDFSDGVTSLREAIFATNLVGGSDTIDFAPSLTASGPGTILLIQGELKITDELTIDGPGADLLTIDASGSDPTPDVKKRDGSRVFNINDGTSNVINVSLSKMTLTGGDVTGSGGAVATAEWLSITDCTVTGNSAGKFTYPEKNGGGGIFSSGVLNVINCVVSGNSVIESPGHGGGILAIGLSLTVVDSIFENNTVGGTSSRGGGIYSSAQSTTISTSTINANRIHGTDAFGAGLYAIGDMLRVQDSTLSGNEARGTGVGGGGLIASAAVSIVSDSVISGNYLKGTTASGGGITAGTGNVTIVNSVITSNVIRGTSTGGGGVILGTEVAIIDGCTITNNKAFGGNGGGVRLRGDNTRIVNTTISGNVASSNGGGISAAFYEDDAAQLTNVTITANSAANGGGIHIIRGDLSVEHTIVAANIDADPRILNPDLSIAAVVTAFITHSLIGNSVGSGLAEAPVGLPDANGNLIGGPVHGVIAPLLGSLADNGGPTFTHALLPGSPAINAGNLNAVAGTGSVPLYDQRGEPFHRIVNGRIDIGAFEYQEPSDLNLLVDTLADESDGNYGRGDLSLREAIALANLWSSTDTIRFDPALTASGPATILLTMGELKITDDVSIVGPGAELLTIDASGNDSTPDRKDLRGSRIFNIDNQNEDLLNNSISALRLTGADMNGQGGAIRSAENLTLRHVAVDGSMAATGGGVLNTNGQLVIEQSSLSANRNGAVTGLASDVMIVNSMILDNVDGSVNVENGDLTLSQSTVTGNSGLAGVRLVDGRLEIVSSTIAENWSGVSATRAEVRVWDSQISNNRSPNSGPWDNGGIVVDNGTLDVAGSTISGNATRDSLRGGGITTINTLVNVADTTIANNAAPYATGIRISGGEAIIARSTFTGNSVFNESGGGGAIHAGNARLTVTESTISGNSGQNTAGIRAVGSEDTTISDVLVLGNVRGIWARNVGATLSITNSRVADNSSNGVYIETTNQGVTTITSTTIENNRGFRGAGVTALNSTGATTTITGSTVSGNIAVRRGGGVYFGLFSGASATLSDSIISGNSIQFPSNFPDPEIGGGGVWILGGGAVLSNCQISDNSSTSNGGGIVVRSLFDSSAPTVIRDCEITNNTTGFDGGGIHAAITQQAPLFIEGCEISQNAAQAGGGIYAQGGSFSALSAVRTRIAENVAQSSSTFVGQYSGHGGGIFSRDITINLTDCVIDQNTAQKDGGGIYNLIQQTNIIRSTVSNNYATNGGGIYGGVDIQDSTIHDNMATGGGGGLRGGGTITQSTVSNNIAEVGAGVYGGNLKLHHSTVAFNRANVTGPGIFLTSDSLHLNHTIVAQNTSLASGGSGDVSGLLGTTITARYSLIGNSSGSGLTPAPVGSPDANGNLIGGTSSATRINPQLAPLSNNGGPTMTHALLPNSPAINVGDPGAMAGVHGVPLNDQRGASFTRVYSGRIDIGAYERQNTGRALHLVVDITADEVDGDYSPGDLSLREAIGLANGNVDYTDTITFHSTLSSSTLLLSRGELTITDSLSILGLGAEQLTIDASGNDPTPDMNDGLGSRIFTIYDIGLPIHLTVADVTLTGGDLEGDGGAIFVEGRSDYQNSLALRNVNVIRNHASGEGGGVSVAGRGLEISGTHVSDNIADGRGGGISMLIFSINGATIANSTITGNSAQSGGGINASGGGSSNHLIISGSQIRNNVAAVSGGGVSALGSATMIDCVVLGNSARFGGGVNIFNLMAQSSVFSGNTATTGGGIQVGYLNLTDCTISQNIASQTGGGIMSGRSATITGTTIADNQAGADGGGIFFNVSNGDVEITQSSVLRNRAAGDGGGIHVFSLYDYFFVDFVMDGCTIGLNTAGGDGGGLSFRSVVLGESASILNSTVSENRANGDGGGVFVGTFSIDAVITFVQCTLSGNDAQGRGGGLMATVGLDCRLDLMHSTIVNNTSDIQGGGISGSGDSRSSTRVNNTIIANNGAPIGRDLAWGAGNIDVRNSLIGPIDPLLAPLAHNGGPTMTHALLPGSPAINTGQPIATPGVGSVPFNDQRGTPFTRVYGGRIDIGAFEFQPTDHAMGDFNRDGFVDSGDYVVWRRAAGSAVQPGTGADGNGDGVVNQLDFALWKGSFGIAYEPPAVVSQPASTVPASAVTGPEDAKASPTAADLAKRFATPTTFSRPRTLARSVREKLSPRQVETADHALAAWVASRWSGRMARQEHAGVRFGRDHAGDSAIEASGKLITLDAAFGSLGGGDLM